MKTKLPYIFVGLACAFFFGRFYESSKEVWTPIESEIGGEVYEFNSDVNYGTPTSGFLVDRQIQTKSGTTRDIHTGVDYPCRVPTRIASFIDGEIKYIGWQTINGNEDTGTGITVVIENDKQQVRYGHLAEKDGQPDVYLKVGDMVQKGQYIGACGTTGFSTGDHIHIEVRDFEIGLLIDHRWKSVDDSKIYQELDKLGLPRELLQEARTHRIVLDDLIPLLVAKDDSTEAVANYLRSEWAKGNYLAYAILGVDPSSEELRRLKERRDQWFSARQEVINEKPSTLYYQERINAFLCNKKSPLCMDFGIIDYSIELQLEKKIHPFTYWVLAFGDTTLCKNLTTRHNCTNFGNTDRGGRVYHEDLKENILYSISLLDGTVKDVSGGRFKGNLSWAEKLGDLSFGGQSRLYGKIVNKNIWATDWTNAPTNHAYAWNWLSEGKEGIKAKFRI